MEERYGKLAMANILTSIWLGDWNRYEEMMASIPETVKAEFSFHSFYNREEVQLWYDNHFFIPGGHFVSPYFSSYSLENEEEETRKKDLLCLIGLYEKTGFLYPLEIERFPDHFGCLTAFLSSLLQEQLKTLKEKDQDYLKQLEELEYEFLTQYILPVLEPLMKQMNEKIKHPFLVNFITYYTDFMKNGWMLTV